MLTGDDETNSYHSNQKQKPTLPTITATEVGDSGRPAPITKRRRRWRLSSQPVQHDSSAGAASDDTEKHIHKNQRPDTAPLPAAERPPESSRTADTQPADHAVPAVPVRKAIVAIIVNFALSISRSVYWAFSVYTNLCLHSVRWYLGLYHGVRICIGIFCLLIIHWVGRVGILRPSKCLARFLFGGARGREKIRLHRQMKKVKDFDEWLRISEQFDKVSGAAEWCASLGDAESINESTTGPTDPPAEEREMRALQSHILAIQQARESCNIEELVFLLRRCCHRNFCGLRNPVHYAHSFIHTKRVIEDFYDEVCDSLDFLAHFVVNNDEEAADTTGSGNGSAAGTGTAGSRSPAGRVFVGYYNVASRRRTRQRSRSGGGSDLDQVSTPIGRRSMDEEYDSGGTSDSSGESGEVCADGRRRLLAPHKFRQAEFIDLLSDLRLSMGRTALCLSGGGALCVLQLGVLKTLMDHNILPTVISGSSGGAFTAALLAVFTDREFKRDVLCGDFLDKRNLRIVSTFREQIVQFWRTGYLLDPAAYAHFARTLIGDITFAEAYARTGRFVSITTTPAGLSGYGEPLVCNVINTPDILIWSAIVASCSLPLVLPPAILYTKRSAAVGSASWAGINSQLWQSNKPPLPVAVSSGVVGSASTAATVLVTGAAVSAGLISNVSSATSPYDGEPSPTAAPSSPAAIYRQLDDPPPRADPSIRPYAPDNMLFVDGSILEDIPHTELQTLFNVKSFIVTQVNPHFTPFIQQPGSYKTEKRLCAVILEHIWNYVALDVRNRYARLLLLSLVPKIRGQDVSPFLMQSAEGHVTIVPASPSDFWKLTRNPGTAEILRAVSEGERKTWPYIRRLEHGMRIEGKLRQLWQKFCHVRERGYAGRKMAGRRGPVDAQRNGGSTEQQPPLSTEKNLAIPLDDKSTAALLDEDDCGRLMASPAQFMLTPRGVDDDLTGQKPVMTNQQLGGR